MTDAMEKPTNAFPGEEEYLRDFSQIEKAARLSREEERELAIRCAQGDESALRQLVIANLHLVISIAREYSGAPVADLIQEGTIGLMKAARKFDYTLDFRFSTYATKWIRQAITRYLIDRGGMIRVPMHTAERMDKIRRAAQLLSAELGREPTSEEIAACLHMETGKVEALLQLNPQIFSLDLPASDKDSLADLMEDLSTPAPEDAIARQELNHLIHTLLSSLTERQRTILTMHFGLGDGKVCSLEQISRTLGISKERTRQIERQAMDKMLALGSSVGLEDFL